MTRQTSTGSTTAIRRFTDCVGESWTVYCVKPPSFLRDAITLLPHQERRNGWLAFECDSGERRRLAPFPRDWAMVSDFELERWCMRATRTAVIPKRRAEDRMGGG